MKLNISEIKSKCEQDDKISFSGKVKIVFPVNVLPKEKVTKYAKARQNVIIKDDTGEIKVIITFKELGNDYSKSIEGKDVEVSGKVSIYNDEKNIFGKLTFAEGEEPKKTTTNVSDQIRPAISALPAIVEIRKMSLKLAVDFWGSRIGHEKDEKGVIKTADLFKEYLLGKAEKVTQKKQKIEEPKEETKSEGEIEKPKGEAELSAEKIALINEIMSLKESRNLNKDTFAHYLDNKDIKEMSVEELKKTKMDINNITNEIPF